LKCEITVFYSVHSSIESRMTGGDLILYNSKLSSPCDRTPNTKGGEFFTSGGDIAIE